MFQISFLNAGLLLFAAATILPLLIWLLAKKKPPQVLFSSLRFIKLSEQQEKSRTKITNIILLIIRMLIILLVSLAVARPMLSSSRFKASDTHPPTAIALVVDTSYSMDYMQEGSTSLQKAVKAIKTINSLATESDRLILISRDAAWNQVHAQIYVKGIPEDVLQSLAIGWQPLPWDEVLALATAKLDEAMMPNSEIYILSNLYNEELSITGDIPVAHIPLDKAETRQNLSISEARLLPQLVSRSKQQSIEFRIQNHAESPRSEILVRAVVNDIKVAEKFLSLEGRQSYVETISFELRDEGWQSGYIEVLDEALLADNRAYFAFEYYRYPKVGVVSNGALPTTLNSILSVYGGGNSPQRIDPTQLQLQDLDSYKLLVFYEFGALTPRLREVINALDQSETGTLFCMPRELPADLKSFLEQRFELSLDSYSNESCTIDYVSPHHRASAIIADKQRKYSEISGFWKSRGGSAIIASGAQALAVSTENSALWLWDIAHDSAFFVDPAFAVYAYSQAAALQSSRVPANELLVGDVIRASQIKLPSLELITPALPRYTASIPGLYEINPAQSKATHLAVNHDYSDSEARQGIIHGKIRHFDEDFTKDIFMSRLGHELWKWLLILALILVIIEIAIVKWQEYKPQQRS